MIVLPANAEHLNGFLLVTAIVLTGLVVALAIARVCANSIRRRNNQDR